MGAVALHPPSWIQGEVARSPALARGDHKELRERLTAEVSELKWAVAVADAPGHEEARTLVEEHVAVLRLYQRFRYRHINVDRQTFGLPETVHRSREDFWVLDETGVIGAGSRSPAYWRRGSSERST